MKLENKIPANPSPILQAVINQSKYTDEEANQILAAREAQKRENEKKAITLLTRSQDIQDYLNIPSKIKAGELNQTPEVHANLKNYDHSLEKVRKKITSEEQGDDGIEFGNLTSKDLLGT